MKIGVMQPYFFPYIGYFQCIHAVDKYILYDNINFIKKQWVNRNQILINKQPEFFSIDLIGKSSFKKIKDVQIFEGNNWRRKIIKILTLNYRKTPYYKEILPFLEFLINYECVFLSQFNQHSICEIVKLLNIKSEIISNSSLYSSIEDKLNESNLEELYSSKYKLEEYSSKNLRILEICKQENSTIYINAIGGQKLYNKEEFKNNGIELFFIKTLDYSYKQKADTFHPHLSIIDVLFNNGIKGTQELITNYELI